MDEKTIVILGGGFGGLTAAHELKERLSGHHRIMIIDKKRDFLMGFSSLWLLSGERSDPGEGRRDLSRLRGKGFEYINEEILSIDPERKFVRTETREIYANYIIISLGADLYPEGVAGFPGNAHDFYTPEGALEMRRELEGFKGGKIAILISSVPFKCPVAPYEAAILIDEILEERNLKDKSSIDIFTPEQSPVAIGKNEVGRKILEMLSERGIKYHPGHRVKRICPERKVMIFEGSEHPYDIIAGVPSHRVPGVIRRAGIQDDSGWIPVDPGTSETRFPGVYAIGDVSSVRIAGNVFLPKSAVFAEGEAVAVAEHISSEISGDEAPKAFNGYGYCFFETGRGNDAPVSGYFFDKSGPNLKMDSPDRENHLKMVEFESSRLKKWFG